VLNESIDLAAIAPACIGALDDGALDELARRVTNRQIQPVLLDIHQTAACHGMSSATLTYQHAIEGHAAPDCFGTSSAIHTVGNSAFSPKKLNVELSVEET
jgi:hypothetical protein